MAQSSIFWPTSGVGDGASQYTDAQLFAWLRRTLTRSVSTEGVHAGYANELAVTGATSPIAVNTGAALVDGVPYENTASVSQAIATPSVGTTGHRIVLRANWAAQTVRVTDIASADGVAAIPAAVQTPGTTYDVTLATLTITTLGAITLTDARSYLHYTSKVSTTMIDDEAITPAKILNRTRRLFVQPRGGYNVTDSAALSVQVSLGLVLPDNKVSNAWGAFVVPTDYLSLTSIKAVVISFVTANAYIRNIANWGAATFAYNVSTQTVGYTATAVSSGNTLEVMAMTLPASPLALLVNDYCQLEFDRDAVNALDTVNTSMYFVGWVVEYIADS